MSTLKFSKGVSLTLNFHTSKPAIEIIVSLKGVTIFRGQMDELEFLDGSQVKELLEAL